jgi:hypothetical protein
MDDENNLPRPQKGDLLFAVDDDWWHNACLNFLGKDWGLYATGYKQAGDILVEHVKGTRRHQDSLIYPIAFLYRQYLELRLKQLIEYGHEILDHPTGFPKHHHLDELWSECKSILKEIEPTIPTHDLEAVDEAIIQFCAVDPTSEGFRYPLNKESEPSLPDDLRYINIRNLTEVMDRIASFFEAVVMMISHYRDIKREMEAAYRDAYGF